MSRYLSLAEVDRGIRDVLGLDEVFDAKRAIFEAFRFAKNSSPVGLSYTESNFLSKVNYLYHHTRLKASMERTC